MSVVVDVILKSVLHATTLHGRHLAHDIRDTTRSGILQLQYIATFKKTYLLANVGPRRPYVGHDLLGILGNLIPVTRGNGGRIKERSDQTNAGGTIVEVIAGIIKINARGGVDGKEGQSRTHSLDPVGSTGNAGEELLERGAVTVGIHKLCGCLAARNTNDVASCAPLDYIGKHDGGDDELGPGIDRVLGIVGVEDGTTADHYISIVFRTEIGQMLKAVGRGQGELNDLESAIDGSLHGLGACLGGRSAEDCAGTDLGKLVEDVLEVVCRFGPIETGDGGRR
mmetsp:Transcript_7383/g.14705  ORF Transcript_7383/g.14705 Transcript_7383/m.14705 type:complete len:282 (-) Transcript_7383:169-1014(-)